MYKLWIYCGNGGISENCGIYENSENCENCAKFAKIVKFKGVKMSKLLRDLRKMIKVIKVLKTRRNYGCKIWKVLKIWKMGKIWEAWIYEHYEFKGKCEVALGMSDILNVQKTRKNYNFY